MMWTVKTSDGAEGEARNGRRGRRHPSPWFSLPMVYHHHLKEEDEDEEEAGRMAHCRGAALLLVDRWRCGGDVVAIASPRSGEVAARPSP